MAEHGSRGRRAVRVLSEKLSLLPAKLRRLLAEPWFEGLLGLGALIVAIVAVVKGF